MVLLLERLILGTLDEPSINLYDFFWGAIFTIIHEYCHSIAQYILFGKWNSPVFVPEKDRAYVDPVWTIHDPIPNKNAAYVHLVGPLSHLFILGLALMLLLVLFRKKAKNIGSFWISLLLWISLYNFSAFLLNIFPLFVSEGVLYFPHNDGAYFWMFYFGELPTTWIMESSESVQTFVKFIETFSEIFRLLTLSLGLNFLLEYFFIKKKRSEQLQSEKITVSPPQRSGMQIRKRNLRRKKVSDSYLSLTTFPVAQDQEILAENLLVVSPLSLTYNSSLFLERVQKTPAKAL